MGDYYTRDIEVFKYEFDNKKYLDDPHFRRILNSLMNIELVTVAVSGYFDPLHVGHLEMLEKAKSLGDKLIVIVNSDEQAALKKESLSWINMIDTE